MIGPTILFCSALNLLGWQQPSTKPNFSGSWQLDQAKSKTEIKDNLIWKIEQKPQGEITIEELSSGKTLSNAKCAVGKQCEFDDNGKRVTAMTYFLDTTLVQMRSTIDNSTVIKRNMKMMEDGSLSVEMVTIVPSDKKELLVFTKQEPSGEVKSAAAPDPPKPETR